MRGKGPGIKATTKATKLNRIAGNKPAKKNITTNTNKKFITAPKKSPNIGTKPVVIAIKSATKPMAINTDNGIKVIVTIPAKSNRKAPEIVIIGTKIKSNNVGGAIKPLIIPQIRNTTLITNARGKG